MNLYEHTKASRALEDLILGAANPETGEISELDGATIDAWAEEVEGGLEAKLEACGIMHANWKADEEAHASAAKHHAAIAKATAAKRERLKAWVKFCLEQSGKPKASGGLFSFAIVGNGGVAPLIGADALDPLTIDPRFQRVTTSVDASAIRAAIEAGETIEGVSIGQRGTSLRIK